MKKLLFATFVLSVLSLPVKACDPVFGVNTFGFRVVTVGVPAPFITEQFVAPSVIAPAAFVPRRAIIAPAVAVPRGQFIQQRFGPFGRLRQQTIIN